SQAGRPEDGTDPKPLSMAEFYVDLKPPSEWPRGVNREDLAAAMENEVGKIPGIEPAISQPIRDNVLESISQIDGQIVIKVFGEASREGERVTADGLRYPRRFTCVHRPRRRGATAPDRG